MQPPFDSHNIQELLLQGLQQQAHLQYQPSTQQPTQVQNQIDERQPELLEGSNTLRKGSTGCVWRSNSDASVDGYSKTSPWAQGPVLQPAEAAGASQGSHVLKVGSRGANDRKSALTSAGEPLKVTVLGAGQDVGRSAVYVRRGERGLLFDCGSHLGAKQARKMPVLNMLLQLAPQRSGRQDAQTMEEALLQPSPLFACCTDAALISHFHMDHCGSLPSFTERLG